jgi:hypothetical protein
MWRSAGGICGRITIAPYFSEKVWLSLTGRRTNRSQANAHPRHPLRHEHFDRGGLRRDGPQPHPTPHGSGWPAFERRPDVCWDRAGVHWAIRRQLVVKLARFPGRKRHTGRELAAGWSSIGRNSSPECPNGDPQYPRERLPRIGPVSYQRLEPARLTGRTVTEGTPPNSNYVSTWLWGFLAAQRSAASAGVSRCQ